MANPRYYNQAPDRSSRRDRNLALALQLAGVSQDQQANADRAHMARVAQALQVLGLQAEQQRASDAHALALENITGAREGRQLTREQMQQDLALKTQEVGLREKGFGLQEKDQSLREREAESRMGLSREELAQRERLAQMDAAFKQLGLAQSADQFSSSQGLQRELAQMDAAMKQMGLAQSMTQFQESQAQQNGQFWGGTLPQAQAATQQQLHLGLLGYLQNQPNADPNVGMNFASSLDPKFAGAHQNALAAALAKQIAGLQPQYNALTNDPNTRGQFESALPANVVAGLSEGYKRSTRGVPEGVASGPAGPSRTSFLGPRAGQQPSQPSLPDLPQPAPAFGVSSYGAPQVNPKAILDWYLRQFAYK